MIFLLVVYCDEEDICQCGCNLQHIRQAMDEKAEFVVHLKALRLPHLRGNNQGPEIVLPVECTHHSSYLEGCSTSK